uniref:Beta-hexosaminidase bacterial type N-terminal domain-containing protein n=1 Tax=Timema cristinae TaxID=61476 RepID=A0A7R9D366_TIMCR|nr:unnamed protein product [Timema cristinae]
MIRLILYRVGRVCQLVAAGININSWDSVESKNTPLHWAACYGNKEIVTCLISRGADVNSMNACGATPLHDAVIGTDDGVVQELLQAGANPLIQANKGRNMDIEWKKDKERGGHENEVCEEHVNCHEEKKIKNEVIWGRVGIQGVHEIIDKARPRCYGHVMKMAKIMIEVKYLGNRPQGIPRKRKFCGKTSLDLASHKPEILALVERFTSFGQTANPTSPVAANHSGDSNSSTRFRSVSVDSEPRMEPQVSGAVKADPHPVLPNNFHERTTSRSGLMFNSQASLDLSPRIDQTIENLLRTHISTPVRPLVTKSSHHLLWPQPQRIIELEGPPFVPKKELLISVVKGATPVHRILDVWDVCGPSLHRLGYITKIGDVQPACGRWTEIQVECTVNEDLFPTSDSYRIHISTEKVRITASNLVGLHYACCTFIQLLRLCKTESISESLSPMLVQDYPAFKHRAVLLDISPRGRIPSLDYLFHMISLWSNIKINHLHLYTRVAPGCDWPLCFSKSEMVTIDRYCLDRFVTLVPVLDVESHVTYDDLTDMWLILQEVLASFPTLRHVHVGPKLCSLLGQCRVEDGENVPHHVPLQELWQILGLPPEVTLMLCSNSLHTQEAAPPLDIPPNILLVEYGFQADYDFQEWTRDFHNQGTMTLLCPGTASWNSLAGCPEASVCNIYRAVQAVGEQGSLGLVVAHWSGSYHLTPHPFSWPGFMVGAGLAWNTSTHWDYLHNSLSDLLDTHIFLDFAGTIGRVIMELGYAETFVLRSSRGQEPGDLSDLPAQDGSTLYRLLTDPDNVSLENLSVDMFGRVTKYIKKCQSNMFQAQLKCEFGEMIIQELQLAADLMLTACRIGRTLIGVGVNPNSNMGLAVINLGVCNLPPTFRTDIANKLLAHIEQYKGTWLQRHLPGGLQNSLLVLTSALHRFVPTEPPHD